MRSRRVGVSTFFRLMAEHGTAHAALDALPGIAADAGVRDYQICPAPVVEQELDWAGKCGATMLCYGAPDYPRQLLGLTDAPPILWAMGDLSLLSRSTVALVGARNASSLGIRMGRKLALDLGAAGHVIVSGLARGIDTAAHQATLDTGTIAVLAGGVDVVYPSENAVLGEEILRKGLRLSEAPMGLAPQARHFPPRNRIISGLSRAVAVVEAAAKSGSLITAEMALEQGREVFAVPGHPFDARATGGNRLIRDGATLLRSAQDMIVVLDEITAREEALRGATTSQAGTASTSVAGPDLRENAEPKPSKRRTTPAPVTIPPAPPERRSLAETSALHRQILDRLSQAPLQEDMLLRDIHVDAQHVATELTVMELEGLIARGPGGTLSRCN
ncbi:DNA-processing protein DprA [Maritimibacter sp. DP1N21-5]|nr:DNA-processing protein DprA [Maritimibacter sp. DP1N21-5]MBV7410630.1 DNA-processing protein DprA [Maritimibacter sp. DP1N21-5]